MIEKFSLNSPIGVLEIVCNNDCITQVAKIYENKQVAAYVENKNAKITKLQFTEYFTNKRKIFTLPIELQGTTFQKKVWQELLNIPYGQTKTYGEIAKAIGQPKSAQAVGGACNKNKLLLLVPCHRVVGANKKLTGFFLGLTIKQFLLDLEHNKK